MKTGPVFLAVCLFASTGFAQQQKLADRVHARGGPISVIVLREFSPVDLSQLVKDCDRIARVAVIEGQTRLSGDEKSMHSDFTVQVLDDYFSTRALKPGERIVVTKPGGTMTIEGHKITSRETDFPGFAAGEEYILFLRFDLSSGHYVVPYGAQGAFRNIGGLVEQVSKDTGRWNQERGRVTILEFTQELTTLFPRQ